MAQERARIARELHDVVAHRVSLMTVQAGAARVVAAEQPEVAARALGAVEQAGRDALSALRHLLGVLRPDGDADATAPQPRVADLPALAAELRAAGLDVTLAVDDAPAHVPARVGLSVYRIVQEALTNALRHAGPGTGVDVRVASGPRCVCVTVDDDGRGVAAAPSPGVGHGLIGMRERAVALGGSLDAAPVRGGGFRVVATLPVAPDAP